MDGWETAVAWDKATLIWGVDPSRFRLDAYGSLMEWSAYGDRSHPNGWEVDHVIPEALGGRSELFNYRALHWRNNVQRTAGLGLLLSDARERKLSLPGLLSDYFEPKLPLPGVQRRQMGS